METTSGDLSLIIEKEFYGKCILAGEHSVIRGIPAVAVPVRGRKLKFRAIPSEMSSFSVSGPNSNETKLALAGALERSFEILGKPRNSFAYQFEIENEIPLGAGLGASAAISASMANFFAELSWISFEDRFDFARKIEDLFHGESSGLDVAVILSNQAIYYEKNKAWKEIQAKWMPKLYLTHTGLRGLTNDCVHQVNLFIAQNPEQGKWIDLQMARSVELICESLQMDFDSGFLQFSQAMRLAQDCFEKWSLVPTKVSQMIQEIYGYGAESVKLTGSGQGGHLLSLWKNSTKSTEMLEFIEV